ncbi:hypothetical protein ScPMuIL_008581 [Solemya velum]
MMKRLSRTQIVVIATCSAVIGIFFLVAAILRIRNYIKRFRGAQEAERRAAIRRSSSALQGSNLSSELARRESAASKSSRQSNSTVKGGNLYFQVNSNPPAPSEPNRTNDRPTVIVTNISPSSPTESNQSMEYIDEENNKKKPTEPVMESDEDELPSDSSPLLLDNGVQGSAPVTFIPPVPAAVPTPALIQTQAPIPNPVTCLALVPVKALVPAQAPAPTPVSLPVQEVDTTKKTGAFNSITSVPEVKVPQQEVAISKTIDEAVSPPILGRESYQNYPDHPVALETEIAQPEMASLVNMFSVSSGLTQSDTSISSTNVPSYCYGNQSEYLWDNGYGNHAYCPPVYGEPEDIMVSSQLDNHLSSIDEDLSPVMDTEGRWRDKEDGGVFPQGQGVFPPDQGGCQDLFNSSSHVNGISPNDKSSCTENSEEPLLRDCSESMSLPAVDDRLLTGADNLAMSDSFENGISGDGCGLDLKMIPFETHMTMDSLDESHELLRQNIENTCLL